MFAYLTPAEARETPIYAAVVAGFLDGPDHTRLTKPERPRDASGRFVKAAPARHCREAGCGRSATSHMWDAETCPAPEAAR